MTSRLVLCSLLMSVSLSGFAETLSGTVSDEGTVIVKAYVALYDEAGSVIVGTGYSDETGRYRLTAPSGKYRLRVSAEDYVEVWVKDIVLDGADKVVDVPMTPGAFVEDKGESQADDCN